MDVNLVILLAFTSAYSIEESIDDFQSISNATLNDTFEGATTDWKVADHLEVENYIYGESSSDGGIRMAFWGAWEAYNSSNLDSYTFVPTLSSATTSVTQVTEVMVPNGNDELKTLLPTMPSTEIMTNTIEDQVNKPIADIWPVKLAAEVPGDLIIGGLMMVHEREDTITCGPIMPQGGIQAVETMLYTLDTVNRGLKHFRIGVHILDDCDKDTYGLEMAVDFIKGKIDLII